MDRESELHAMANGELDGATRSALATHLRGCVGCRAALARLEALDVQSRESVTQRPVRRSLRDAVRAMLPAARNPRLAALDESDPRARTARWLGGGVIGMLGALAVFMLGMPGQNTSGLEDEFVAAHVRSLSASRLTDVQVTGRQHGTPWFDRRIGFSPTVADLAAAGFPLMGTRVDQVSGRRVAVMVYGTSLQPITVFVWPKPLRTAPLSAILRRDRFNMLRWESGELEYFAVSGVSEADLEQFRATFRQASQ